MDAEKLNADIKNIITLEQAWYYKIVPFKEEGSVFYYYALEHKVNKELLAELEVVLNQQIVLHPSIESHVNQLLNLNYPRGQQNGDSDIRSTQALQVKENGFVEFLVKEAKDL